MPPQRTQPLPAGRCLGPYEIVSPLGSGGMGAVYEAPDRRLERRVALKTLRPDLLADSDARRRFEREARALSALNHPNICTVHHVTYMLARLAALRGDADEAARWLKETIDWGFPCYPMSRQTPFWTP